VKAALDCGALLQAAQLAARVAGKSGTSIGHVLIEAIDGDVEVSLTATDYERSARSTVDAEIEYPGAAAVDAAKLAAICGVLGAGPVTLEASRGVLTLQTTMARFSLPVFGENVPVPGPDSFDIVDDIAVVDGPRLASLLETIAQFASKDDTRPAIGCVCVRAGHVLATDGRFAAIAELGEMQIPDLMIPLASVGVLVGEIGARRVADVGLSVVGLSAAFVVGRARIVTRISDLKFPDLETIRAQVVTGGNAGALDVKPLLQGLRVAAVCGASEGMIRLISDAEGLRVKALGVATATAATVKCGASLFAAPVEILLSAPMLRIALASCGPGSAIRIHGAMLPVLIESGPFKFILMPMKGE
jgi:DNA polymerase-3 subunit beta